MEHVAHFLLFIFLLIILLLIYRFLFLRQQILSYLKENYKSTYEEIHFDYTIKDILLGDPEIIKNYLKQERKILSEEILYDKQLNYLQKQYKRTCLLGLITVTSYLIFLFTILRFLLSTWTWYI